jgi:DNA-binding transcriptional regulator YiaG
MQIIDLVLAARDIMKTNRALAAYLGIEHHAVRNWIIGKHEPNIKYVRAMEKITKEIFYEQL